MILSLAHIAAAENKTGTKSTRNFAAKLLPRAVWTGCAPVDCGHACRLDPDVELQ